MRRQNIGIVLGTCVLVTALTATAGSTASGLSVTTRPEILRVGGSLEIECLYNGDRFEGSTMKLIQHEPFEILAYDGKSLKSRRKVAIVKCKGQTDFKRQLCAVISDIKLADEENFLCEFGSINRSIDFKIEKLALEARPGSNVPEGGFIDLTCTKLIELPGTNSQLHFWFKENLLVPNKEMNSNIKSVKNTSKISQIRLRNVGLQHSGQYWCEFNEFRSTPVDVKIGGLTTRITPRNPFEGDQVEVHCRRRIIGDRSSLMTSSYSLSVSAGNTVYTEDKCSTPNKCEPGRKLTIKINSINSNNLPIRCNLLDTDGEIVRTKNIIDAFDFLRFEASYNWVTEGTNVTFTCQSSKKLRHLDIRIRNDREEVLESGEKMVTYNLMNATVQNSGWYTCEFRDSVKSIYLHVVRRGLYYHWK
ncbi:uncharacterized protein LOC141909033 isoform X2 [Tubulanus polymorphus]|uniref:uncharacterized protein LOC141909033 isoform X2 n=1 Tax=Tubulanus polymorphus TaxID=672921 RepID=UPI003DA56DE2